MNDPSLFARHPWAALLIILGIVALPCLWVFGFRKVSAQMAGWKRLVEDFPPTEIERPGDVFKRQTGWIGKNEFSRSFTLQLIQEGLLVRPAFAPRSPILIPWARISAVAAPAGRLLGYEQNLLLTVAWEKSLQFSLPRQALPVVEQNVPADRFSRDKVPSSIGELLQERWQNRKQG